MTPEIALPMWLAVQTVIGGKPPPPYEMDAKSCLERQHAINSGEAVAYAHRIDGPPVRIVWARCNPWPPLECVCGGDESEQETQ